MDTLLEVPLTKVLLLSCLCVVAVRGQNTGAVDPLSLNRADPRCWDLSSALLLEMRSPRIADTIPAFWELMLFLRSSDNGRHTALYWDLAQVFSEKYADCVQARSHGLGRRQLRRAGGHVTAVRSLVDKSLWIEHSKANYSKWKQSFQTWHTVRMISHNKAPRTRLHL